MACMPPPSTLTSRLAASRTDLTIAGTVFTGITFVLLLDRSGDIVAQRLLGLLTWTLLLVFLHDESPLVRAQVAVVVAFATTVEYLASPLFGVYIYRLHN